MLAVPSWRWWTVHNAPSARVWSAVVYRWPAPIVHRFGGHWRWRENGIGAHCTWCGKHR